MDYKRQSQRVEAVNDLLSETRGAHDPGEVSGGAPMGCRSYNAIDDSHLLTSDKAQMDPEGVSPEALAEVGKRAWGARDQSGAGRNANTRHQWLRLVLISQTCFWVPWGCPRGLLGPAFGGCFHTRPMVPAGFE